MSSPAQSKSAIHETAIIDPSAIIGDGVIIDAFVVIGPNVSVGSGTWIGHHTVVQTNTVIGENCRIYFSAVLGADPQDLKYAGEETWLHIGDSSVIREFSSLHRGTVATGKTEIGSSTLIMAFAHVAHDCTIANNVILANGVQLAGHVSIEEYAIIGGLTPIHQFCRVGAHSMIGGACKVRQDVAPFMKAADDPLRLITTNDVGLRRRGFSPEARQAIRRAHRLLCRSQLNTTQALEAIRSELSGIPEIESFLRFFQSSERGFVK